VLGFTFEEEDAISGGDEKAAAGPQGDGADLTADPVLVLGAGRRGPFVDEAGRDVDPEQTPALGIPDRALSELVAMVAGDGGCKGWEQGLESV